MDISYEQEGVQETRLYNEKGERQDIALLDSKMRPQELDSRTRYCKTGRSSSQRDHAILPILW